MRSIELLSPAGSIGTLYAGINAGADAVYIGGQLFGARAYADNPDNSQLLEAIDYVHLNNKKIYLTVNTLLKDREIEGQLYNYLSAMYEQGLDAVIVQDMGVFMFIKENFPDMDIHASTQMSVSGIDGAKILKESGASRIVTAREISLSEINAIHNNVDIEIESFIHGAMCYSYSGMCLFSSIAGGRSGNRGRCAGPCRQPYEVYDGNRRINDKNSMYALSLKDMNTLSILPEIIEAGVYSLKIEGRMKSPEYVAGVVSVYRKYIDLYLSKGVEKYTVSKNDMNNLSCMYSRSGSTTGYYKVHNSKSMISFEKPSYKTDNDEFISNIREKYCKGRIRKEADVEVILKENEPSLSEIHSGDLNVSVTGEKVQPATNRPLSREDVLKQINKTKDSLLKFHKIFIDVDDNIFMPVKHLNELRRKAIEEFINAYVIKYRRRLLAEEKHYNYKQINASKTDTSDNINFICAVSTAQQAQCVSEYKYVNEIYVSTDYMSVKECAGVLSNIIKSGKKCYVIMPAVFREKGIIYMERLLNIIHSDKVGFVIRNIDELGYVINHNIKDYIVDNSLYAFNKYAYNFFKQHGAKRITLSYELNRNELIRQSYSDSELIVYGKIPLMITSGCVNKNYNSCDKIQKIINLKDRLGYNFEVYNCCNFCYNVIYNSIPLSLLGVYDKLSDIGTKNYRINFTLENCNNVKVILDKFTQTVYYKDAAGGKFNNPEDYEFTRGHFNRGVE